MRPHNPVDNNQTGVNIAGGDTAASAVTYNYFQS